MKIVKGSIAASSLLGHNLRDAGQDLTVVAVTGVKKEKDGQAQKWSVGSRGYFMYVRLRDGMAEYPAEWVDQALAQAKQPPKGLLRLAPFSRTCQDLVGEADEESCYQANRMCSGRIVHDRDFSSSFVRGIISFDRSHSFASFTSRSL